jgi:hypothetical protein
MCYNGGEKIISERERAFGRGGSVAEAFGCQSNVPLANPLRLVDMSAAILGW